jgi:cell wall assembly regulator SMI1
MPKKTTLTVEQAWQLIHTWMDGHCPTLLKRLNKPATPKAIAKLEKAIGLALPDTFKESYRIHDGADRHSGPIAGVPFLSIERIIAERRDANRSLPDFERELGKKQLAYHKGRIQEVARNPRWVPFAGPDEQNYLALDFDPGPKGTPGQVINFGADEFIYPQSKRYVWAPSFLGFLNTLADLFTNGQVEAADEYPDGVRYLQLVRRRDGGTTCNLLTGADLLFGNEWK